MGLDSKLEIISKKENRIIILIALFLIAFCNGGTYAWSVFSPELARFRNWDYAQVTFAFSLFSFFEAAYGLPLGLLLDKIGPKKILLISAICFGGGWIFAGISTNIFILYVLFGLFASIGAGGTYTPVLSTAIRWFPDKRGTITGIITGGIGISALIIAPLANYFLNRFNVSIAFVIFGIAFFVIIFVSNIFVKNPPQDGFNSDGNAVGLTWKEMLKDKRFPLVWLLLFGNCFAGLMLIGNASIIGIEMAGLTQAKAAALVGVISVSSFMGRIIFGVISDIIGRYKTLFILFTVAMIMVVSLCFLLGVLHLFIAFVIIYLCYGGILACMPNLVSEIFGLKYMGSNYGIVFTAYGVAALLGPMCLAYSRQLFNTYLIGLVTAAIVLFISAILVLLVKNISKREAYL